MENIFCSIECCLCFPFTLSWIRDCISRQAGYTKYGGRMHYSRGAKSIIIVHSKFSLLFISPAKNAYIPIWTEGSLKSESLWCEFKLHLLHKFS